MSPTSALTASQTLFNPWPLAPLPPSMLPTTPTDPTHLHTRRGVAGLG